ncbi:hypothetical protein L914_09935 [Phytophthora nicotianae]|uniref:Uncharacterized protein n=1 Tax=Phytophthora nicotianae TaxID=4792 RepID=W2NB05_PHYNI|nr:hypothetical protein L914_09935 [Phytophthora nicotianae]
MGETFGDSKYVLVLKDHTLHYYEVVVANTANNPATPTNHITVPSLGDGAQVKISTLLPYPTPLPEFYQSDAVELQAMTVNNNVDKLFSNLLNTLQDMDKVVQD